MAEPGDIGFDRFHTPEPPVAGPPVLWVSDAADGPPTDGSVFWWVKDESCD